MTFPDCYLPCWVTGRHLCSMWAAVAAAEVLQNTELVIILHFWSYWIFISRCLVYDRSWLNTVSIYSQRMGILNVGQKIEEQAEFEKIYKNGINICQMCPWHVFMFFYSRGVHTVPEGCNPAPFSFLPDGKPFNWDPRWTQRLPGWTETPAVLWPSVRGSGHPCSRDCSSLIYVWSLTSMGWQCQCMRYTVRRNWSFENWLHKVCELLRCTQRKN